VSTGPVPPFRGPGSWGFLLMFLLVLAVAVTGALWAFTHQGG
jgi:hypothetical protein